MKKAMNIRAVFFDFGGVIQRTEFQAPRQRLAQRFGMDYDDIDKLVFSSPSAIQATIGAVSESEHWQAIAQRLKVRDEEIQEVEKEFFAGDIIDHSLLQYLSTLRPRFITGLISNAWSGMRVYIQRQRIAGSFDHLVISAEVGAAKPEARIYQIALEQAQVRADEAVFVDDVVENIEACERVGMKGILFMNSQDAVDQLEKILRT
ncbi:MAG: HAD family phosphatase [Chloroflexi bacterium CFX2]|nr:HAD family phosphatase [Chloroflexi bacterium CFX2]